jgi:hypothetical protein
MTCGAHARTSRPWRYSRSVAARPTRRRRSSASFPGRRPPGGQRSRADALRGISETRLLLPPRLPPAAARRRSAPLAGEAPCGCTVAHPIATWQIWNEQNSSEYFAPQVSVTATRGWWSAPVLDQARRPWRRRGPRRDVGPSSAQRAVTPVRRYLQRLYMGSGGSNRVSTRSRCPSAASVAGSLEALEVARRVVNRAHDANAGTCVTRSVGGLRAAQEPRVQGREGRGAGARAGAFEADSKAAHLSPQGRVLVLMRDKAGGESICEWCGHAGLSAKDGAAKPAWRAFAKVAKR